MVEDRIGINKPDFRCAIKVQSVRAKELGEATPEPISRPVFSSPTVPLSAIGLRSVGWNTVRAPNIGHFRVVLGAHKGLSGLLMGSPGLNGTVGLRERPGRADEEG